MLRFIASTIFRCFSLFFLIYVVSHWSDLEKVHTRSFSNVDNLSSWEPWKHFFLHLSDFLFSASKHSVSSVLEVVNFVLFIGKKGTMLVKSKTGYET